MKPISSLKRHQLHRHRFNRSHTPFSTHPTIVTGKANIRFREAPTTNINVEYRVKVVFNPKSSQRQQWADGVVARTQVEGLGWGSLQSSVLSDQTTASGSEADIDLGHSDVIQAPKGALNLRHAVNDAECQLICPILPCSHGASLVWMTGVC
jgi:hypothetical protein